MLVKLEDVCEILDNKRVPITAQFRKSGIYPYYGANGLQDYIDDYIFDDELVLLAEDGGNFGSKDKPIAYRVSGKCWVNNHAHVLKPIENKINVDYLCYSLMFYDVSNIVNGSTRKKLNQAEMRNMLIPLKSMEEQLHIVAILDLVNDLISLRNQQLEQLDLLVKSRFSEIFKLKNYPLKTLKECSVFIDYRGHTPVVSDTGTIRMINAKSVGKGFFKYIDEYVSEETYNSWMHRGFGEPGDVLIVTEGHTFGNVCRIPKDLTKFALGQRVITIRGINNLINNVYLSSYMQLDEFFQKINKYKTGGTAQGIRSKDLITITIPIPPLALQNQFSAFVEEVEKEKATVKQCLEQLDILKKKLMQEYFG